MTFIQTIARLEQALAGPLPGREAQLRVAPISDDQPPPRDVAGRNCREAGVLVLLHPMDDRAHVVLTLRRDDLADHAGQVAFPGGRREHDEPLLQTALREAHEEISANPGDVEVLGGLTPLYIPPSNFCVYPFVGYTTAQMDFTPHDQEVARIIHVPVDRLLQADAIAEEVRSFRGIRMRVPYFDLEGLQVWGATAMMLSELTDLLATSRESG